MVEEWSALVAANPASGAVTFIEGLLCDLTNIKSLCKKYHRNEFLS